MRAIDLFAGIGGMTLAAPPAAEVVAAYEQDADAAVTYRANHAAPVVTIDLASVTERELLRHEADTWLLSPPCQPFTVRGRRRDVDDPRCAALLRLTALLPACRPRRVLLENVPGFHSSRMHARLIAALEAIGLDVRDVEACPTELGELVRRRRHFVVASADGLSPLPEPTTTQDVSLSDVLDDSVGCDGDDDLRVPAALRSRIARPPDGRVNALPLGTFTRSYGRAIEGAGPLHWDERGPRYFSPDEILRLHGFPPSFAFPGGLSLRTRWRLAGNSVHVDCVRRVAAMLVGTRRTTPPRT